MGLYVISNTLGGKNLRVKMTDEIEKRTEGFYVTLEGEGIKDDEILLGSDVRLVFHVPKLSFSGESIDLGFTVSPYSLQFHDEDEPDWYKALGVPCEKTEIIFSFKTPTEAEWKKDITPGFAFTFDANGLCIFSQFLKVHFVSSFSNQPRNKKFVFEFDGFDLEKRIGGIVKRVRDFQRSFQEEREWGKE